MVSRLSSPLWRSLPSYRAGNRVLDHPLSDVGESREVRLSPDGRYPGVGSVSGRFLLLEVATGSLRWSYMTYGQIRGIVFRGDKVFVGSGDNHLYAFNLSGDLLWRKPIVTFPLFMGASEDGSLIVAAGKSQEAIAYDGDGNLLWRRDLDHNITAGAMARDGSVTVLYSVSGNVWAFDRDGALLFRRHMGQWVHNGVAITSDGHRCGNRHRGICAERERHGRMGVRPRRERRFGRPRPGARRRQRPVAVPRYVVPFRGL